jgi:PAS domain S-box-containing protein
VVRELALEELQLLERLEAGVVLVDEAGLVVRWNAQAERILGLSAAAAVGRPWTEIVSIVRGENTSGRELRAAAVKPGGWHGRAQLRIGSADLWVRAHVEPFQISPTDAGPGLAAIFWLDPTESSEDAARLPYRDLLRHSPEALFLIDLDGTVIDASSAGAELFATTAGPIAGKSLTSLLPGWDGIDSTAARRELLRAGSIVREAVLASPKHDPHPVEFVVTLVSPTEGGLALVRLRDMTEVRQFGAVLRSLDDLAGLARSTSDVDAVASRALDVVYGVWRADLSVVAVASSGSAACAAGPEGPGSAPIQLSSVNCSDPRLIGAAMRIDAPLDFDLSGAAARPELAQLLRAYGCQSLRATPLWFGDRPVGALLLFWSGAAPEVRDPHELELAARLIGIAIGNAELRGQIRHEAELRTSLEIPARLGAVVVNQMTDAIVTSDASRVVTVVNPAAERLYGFRTEEVVGRPLREVVEQFELDGRRSDRTWLDSLEDTGYWQGRVIHKPLVGASKDRSIVVDLSATVLHDDHHRLAGMVGLIREVAAGAQLDSDAAALAAVAVASSRSRTRQEVADTVLERLCEVTMADFGMIGTRVGVGIQPVEASRGLNDDTLKMIEGVVLPQLSAALDGPIPIVPIESIAGWLEGREELAALRRNEIASGFLVSLRVRDVPVGFLGLASRRPTWMRPRDEVVMQIASQVASALENARLMQRLEEGLDQERRLTAQLETLMSLTLLPRGEISEEAIAGVLLDRIVTALEADGGFVVREAERGFQVEASRHLPASMQAALESLPRDAFPFWRRLKSAGDAGAFQERTADAHDLETTKASGVTAQAVIPIREGDRLVGAFVCFFTRSTEERMPADDRNVEAVGRIISIAYSNVRMSGGLAEAAEDERRLRAELQALQELTLLAASTDDLARLATETIQEVVMATGASGGGYILVDPTSARVDPVAWVGSPSRKWRDSDDTAAVPANWPPFAQLRYNDGVWLSGADADRPPGSGPNAEAVLPLRVDDRLAGVLQLEWSEQPRSDQYDVHFLEPIARICSISLANFRLRSELVHRAAAQRALGHRLDTLDELTRIGEEASSFEELAHRTVSLVREALGARGVCYLLIEPGHHFETHAVSGETGAFRLWLKGVPARDAPGGSLLLAGGGSVLGDFTASQVHERVLPLAEATGFKSFGAIPVRTGDELAGTLLCFFDQPTAALPIDESALDSVARIAGIALANYRLRERLVSSEERYRTLFEESPDALLVTALDGTVLDANEAAVRMYRVNRGEALGRYIGQLICADEREMARRRQIVWAQGRGTFQDRGRRPDGSEFPVEVEVRVVELGGQRRFLHLMRDLSDQDRLQRELLQAQKMEAIGQLVSGVAHELNNPLAAIIAFSQLLRSDDRLPDDMKHDAGLLVQEADRTRRIVQNLLDFARARPPERRPISIKTLVQSVLELQSYALSTNRIQVKLDIPDTLPPVDLDRAQMQQVLLNLTINAIQAMRGRDRKNPPHLWVSSSRIRSRPGSLAPGAVRPLDDGDRVRITIRDDGPGVPESARARLFDPFFTTKQPGDGTGLGLSVSFGIVAAHGGHLWYEPGPGGVGSSFILELPVTARNLDDMTKGGEPATADLLSPYVGPAHALAALAAEGAVAEAEGAVAEAEGAVEPAMEAAPAGGARGPARGTRGQRPAARGAAKDPDAGLTKRKPAAHAASPTRAPVPSGATSPVPPSPPSLGTAPARVGPNGAAVAAPPPAGPGERPPQGERSPGPRRPRVLALDDEPSIRAFLLKALTGAGLECVPFQDGAQALDGVREMDFDVMLIDHRMAGMSGTEFYEAAVEIRPKLAQRAVFMSGDVLNPDLRGFATQRRIRLLAKPFDIDTAIRVVREALADAEAGEAVR